MTQIAVIMSYSIENTKGVRPRLQSCQGPNKSLNKLETTFDDITVVSEEEESTFTESEQNRHQINADEKIQRRSSNVNPAILINGIKATIPTEDKHETRLLNHSDYSDFDIIDIYTISHPATFV